jgi:hypothetical protein
MSHVFSFTSFPHIQISYVLLGKAITSYLRYRDSGQRVGYSITSFLVGLVGTVKHRVSTAKATQHKSQSVIGAVVINIKFLASIRVDVTNLSELILPTGRSRWIGLCSNPRVMAVLQGFILLCFTINGICHQNAFSEVNVVHLRSALKVIQRSGSDVEPCGCSPKQPEVLDTSDYTNKVQPSPLMGLHPAGLGWVSFA